MSFTIQGSGSFLPGAPVPNQALAKVMDTSHEWIFPRTGIAQRHYADEGQGVSDLALEASRRALENAGLDASDIDYIIFATMTPDYLFPGSGCLLGAKLGIRRVPALDIRQQCAAVPYGFQVADGLIRAGVAERILFVGAETHASFMPWDDWDVLRGTRDDAISRASFERGTRHRGVAVLFGDGAGALILEKAEDNAGVLASKTYSDGEQYDRIYLPAGFSTQSFFRQEMLDEEKQFPRMRGKDLFKTAVVEMTNVVKELCAETRMAVSDIDWVIAHQANRRILEAVREKLKIPPEKMPYNIERYGNTSAGTIPILTDELRREQKLKQGDVCCFVALGSGLNWGATLMRL